MSYSVDKEDLNDILINSIKSNEVLYIKNFISEFLSWEDFVSIINYQYNNSEGQDSFDKIKNQSSGKPTKISKYTDFHYHLLELTFTNNSVKEFESKFPLIQSFMEYVRQSIKSRATLKALVNIVGNEFTGNMHNDPYHVFSVQHVGTVDYHTLKSDGSTAVYTLEPGDLIFMPSGTMHSISAPSPRGTLILDIEQYR